VIERLDSIAFMSSTSSPNCIAITLNPGRRGMAASEPLEEPGTVGENPRVASNRFPGGSMGESKECMRGRGEIVEGER